MEPVPGFATLTAMAPNTRDDLVRAGLELNDELPLDRLYSGVTTAAVAARAGVTTGSFFHHFHNAAEFATALVGSFDESFRPNTETVARLGTELGSRSDVTQVLGAVLQESWSRISHDADRQAARRGQMHLFAHHLTRMPDEPEGPVGRDSTVDTDSTDSTVGDVLRDLLRSQIVETGRSWRGLLEITGMRLADPFDVDRLAVAVHALLLGLEIIHEIDPDAVDDRLFAETTATLASTVSKLDLRPRRVVVATELGQEPDGSPQARSGARRRRESRQRVVASAAGMFGDGWDSVTATEVADAAGVSTQTVLNLFGNVRRVCAATFSQHAAELEDVLESSPEHRPLDALHDALVAIARAAAEAPHAARALLAERVGVHAERGFDLDDDDIRVIVPVGIRLAVPLSRATGWDTSDDRLLDLNATLIDFVLANAAPRPGRSERTAELAMRLLPPEALP